MNNQSDIERVVMRRVHTTRLLRPFLSGGAFALFALALALWGIGREVWVAQVFTNAPRDIAHIPNFWLAAFEHTRLLVQLLALASFAALVYLTRETARLATHLFLSPARV